MLRHILFASALIAAGSAQAVSFTSTPFDSTPAGQHVIVDFDHPTPAGVVYSGSYTINNLAVSGFRAPPAGDTTNYFATPATEKPTPGAATIDFTNYIAAHGMIKKISFYWGSIDGYNTVSFAGNGFMTPSTFSGNDINNPANGDQSSPATNRRVTFSFGKGEHFTGLTLTSGQRAFEIDNIAATVPEPTTWALLLVGFAMVGGAARYRTRAIAA